MLPRGHASTIPSPPATCAAQGDPLRQNRSPQRLVEALRAADRACRSTATPRAGMTSTTAGASGDDRRAFPRRDSGSTVAVLRVGGNEHVPATELAWRLRSSGLRGELIEISLSGAVFRLPQPLDAGEPLVLRLANTALGRELDLDADVLRVLRTEGDGWRIVCCFANRLGYEQIRDFSRTLESSALV